MCYLCYNYLENLEVRREIPQVSLQVILAVHGDPNQNLNYLFAITLKLCISGKAKMCLRYVQFF